MTPYEKPLPYNYPFLTIGSEDQWLLNYLVNK
jgi:hypothetical protein